MKFLIMFTENIKEQFEGWAQKGSLSCRVDKKIEPSGTPDSIYTFTVHWTTMNIKSGIIRGI